MCVCVCVFFKACDQLERDNISGSRTNSVDFEHVRLVKSQGCIRVLTRVRYNNMEKDILLFEVR